MHFLRTVLLLIAATSSTYSASRSIFNIIRESDEFSSFRSLLYRHNPYGSFFRGNVTVFAPTNAAFAKYKGVLDEKILLNHLVNWTLPLETLDSRTRIVTQDNYPYLWVTRGKDFLFVNNAKIDLNRSNYVFVTQQAVQILYVIDEVLAPVCVTPTNNPARAIDFMQARLQDFSHFFSAIIDNNATSFFTNSNRNTYFIPINTRFSGLHKREIDLEVLRGHIVPFHALFTSPSPKNFHFSTMYQPSLSVVLSFFEEDGRIFVESSAVRGATTSNTIAEIVEANISVENGVIHVINTTLATLSHTPNAFPYLTMDYKLSGDPSLSFALSLTQNAGYYGILTQEDIQLTFFVPRNHAWLLYSEKGKRVLEYCAKIFFRKQMVVGEVAYTMEDLQLRSRTGEVTLHSLGGMISLGVKKIEDEYYLLWRNKTIRVYKKDYTCVNGFVHVVDAPFVNTCDLIACRQQYAAYLRNVTTTW